MRGAGNYSGFLKETKRSRQQRTLRELEVRLKAERDRQRALESVVEELASSFEHFTWVGIYAVEDQKLVLKSWRGPQATRHTQIPLGEGICGLAARNGETVVVPDVTKHPRYLQCFPSTKCEIVVPIKVGDEVVGEIDIDSDETNVFDSEDVAFLEQVSKRLSRFLR